MIVFASAMIVMATAVPLSPNQVFIFVSVLHLTRAGTGLCQLFVFFPYNPASKPAAAGQIHPSTDATGAIGSPGSISIDTRLLAGESAIVRALTENNGRLEQENARLLEIQETNDRLQQEQTAQLELENKMKEAENKRLKNDRAADSSMNHTVKVHT
jgi:hypothetical protein